MASAARAVDVSITGEEHVRWFSASPEAERGFCSTCGSLLFWRPEGGDSLSLMAGAFDEPSVLRTAGHIFCADKGEYYEIPDDTLQFAQADSGELRVWIEPAAQ